MPKLHLYFAQLPAGAVEGRTCEGCKRPLAAPGLQATVGYWYDNTALSVPRHYWHTACTPRGAKLH